MEYILIGFGIYILYRFVVGFLIPVIKTTNQVKKQFGAMKEKMEEAYNQQAGRQQAHANTVTPLGKTTSGKPGAKEDYIEYEDV
jgi:hypothetical protein